MPVTYLPVPHYNEESSLQSVKQRQAIADFSSSLAKILELLLLNAKRKLWDKIFVTKSHMKVITFEKEIHHFWGGTETETKTFFIWCLKLSTFCVCVFDNISILMQIIWDTQNDTKHHFARLIIQ